LGRSVETSSTIFLGAVGELVGEEVGFEVVGFAVVGFAVFFNLRVVGFAVVDFSFFFNVRVVGRTSTVPMSFNKLENV